MSATTKAIVPRLLRPWAIGRRTLTDWYPISSATLRMRSAVAKLTLPGRAKARETVDAETPTMRATS